MALPTATAASASRYLPSPQVRTHVGDVTDRDALRTWILEVDEAAPLDLAIANAGVTETTSHTEADLERAARDIFAVNVDGVWNTIFPALVGMRRRGAGQIALVSSIAGYGALTGSAAYSASKAAVRVYGDSLRAQLHREGIAVTVICPGVRRAVRLRGRSHCFAQGATRCPCSLAASQFVQSPMTDASARHTPQPFKVSMRYAVNRIVGGLARDEKQIAFPNIVAVVGYWIAQMPSLVRDVLARNRLIGAIKYMSVKRGGGAATAATSDARPGSGTPATAAAAAAAGEGAASGSGGGVARAPSSRSAKKV